MNMSISDELKGELLARGFTASLEAPNKTMQLVAYSTATELVDLLDMMVARREKIFRSVNVVGPEAAKKSYDDVVLVIEAIRAVIGRMSLM
jgi:hypothetical protein